MLIPLPDGCLVNLFNVLLVEQKVRDADTIFIRDSLVFHFFNGGTREIVFGSDEEYDEFYQMLLTKSDAMEGLYSQMAKNKHCKGLRGYLGELYKSFILSEVCNKWFKVIK